MLCNFHKFPQMMKNKLDILQMRKYNVIVSIKSIEFYNTIIPQKSGKNKEFNHFAR